MSSYQDIDTRLRVIEDKVDFVMKAAQMTAAISSGLFDDNGNAVPPRVFKGSLLEVYKMTKQMPVEMESENGN